MFTTVICVDNIRRIAAACFFSGFTQEIVLILLVQPYRTTVGIFDVYCIVRSFHTLLASLVRISVVKRREAKQRVSERALTAGPIILAHVWVGALYAAECGMMGGAYVAVGSGVHAWILFLSGHLDLAQF